MFYFINFSIKKNKIISVVKYISKFQDDLLNQIFLLRVDCSVVKQIIKKDIKNLASK